MTIFEALHDMSRPADAPQAARGMLRQPGPVIIAGELAGELTAPAPSLECYHEG